MALADQAGKACPDGIRRPVAGRLTRLKSTSRSPPDLAITAAPEPAVMPAAYLQDRALPSRPARADLDQRPGVCARESGGISRIRWSLTNAAGLRAADLGLCRRAAEPGGCRGCP